MFALLVALPESSQEIFIIAQPSLTLDEVQEHAAIEQLQGIVVRPAFIIRLLPQVFLKNSEERSIVIKEFSGDRLNIKSFFVLCKNCGKAGGLDRGQIEQGDPLRSSAQAFFWPDGNTPEEAAFRVFIISFDVNEVPYAL